MGLPNWWLGLSDYDYQSVLTPAYLKFDRGYSLTDSLEAHHPDYVILDDGLNGILVKSPSTTIEGFDIFNLPRDEFFNFLNQRGKKFNRVSGSASWWF